MATTIHVPDALLRRVDARAKALGVSRNRVILDAIEQVLATRADWPPELMEMLATPLDAATSKELGATLGQARRRRSGRRKVPRL